MLSAGILMFIQYFYLFSISPMSRIFVFCQIVKAIIQLSIVVYSS